MDPSNGTISGFVSAYTLQMILILSNLFLSIALWGGGGVNTLDTITNRSTEDNISSSHVAVLIVCIENVPLTAYKTIHLQQ